MSHITACSVITSQTTSRGRARISSTISEVKRIKRPKNPETGPADRPHLSPTFDNGRLRRRQLARGVSNRDGNLDSGLGFQRKQVHRNGRRMVFFPGGDHGRKEASV